MVFDKLTSIENKYEQMAAEMADPAVQADNAKISENEELLKDPDMRELAQEEMKALEARRDALLADIKVLLVPKDPNDAKNIILEIRAGTGGDEASLFAADLFRMYSRFAERNGWKIEMMSINDSGAG